MLKYQIQGRNGEISETIKTLLKEEVIEPTQSFYFNSPIWPVLKPSGKWGVTGINKLFPKLPG